MNLEKLDNYSKKRLEETGCIPMSDFAALIGISKSGLKYYEEEGYLTPDFIVSHGHENNMRLYKLETVEAFIKWYKLKSLQKSKKTYLQKEESQDEKEWKNYLKELHL